ncbi:RNA polymerase subunit sigma [Clostridium sporogenes]|uniref:RNA polymerase subunit sigma n=1 Tax=Clostridium sporogenes TaxID=1509 RepID=UPI0015EE7195|nr:RNA polymerase subunit sigma [Clostridium sporogenes]MBA4507101.1 RNA polymerase subunit sigma [Clostridium sporogenes]MDU6336849.1 RNA polymerase subunit sigma [Clostridium sporogenes]
MENKPIEILGITSEEEISKYNIQYPYKEFCKSYTISLVNNNPRIGQILKVFLEPKIREWKYIFTQGQYKIFMEGCINIRVLFLENPYDENIYSTEINKIISGFLPVESDYTDSLKPTLFIEEAFIAPLNENKFSVSLLIGMGTILQMENEDVKEYTEVLEVEDNFKEEIEYDNMEEVDLKEDIEYGYIQDVNFKEEIQYEEVEDINLKEEVHEEVGDADLKEKEQYEEAKKSNLKEEVQYEEVEDINLKEEVHEEVGDTDLKEKEQYEEAKKLNLKEEVQYEEVEDTNLKEEVQYEEVEESNLKEKAQAEGTQGVNLKEEIEYEDIKDGNFKGNIEYKNVEEIVNNNLDEINLAQSIYDLNLQEVNLEETDFNEMDIEKLKENAINIDMEYDMNLNEKNF